MQKKHGFPQARGLASITILAFALPSLSNALQFDAGDTSVTFSSTLSAGASWRMEEMNPTLVTSGNHSGGGASTAVTDDGDLNYDKGDMFSLLVQGRHDLVIERDKFGIFTRARWWNDYAMKNANVNHGNAINYEANTPLDDSGFDDLAQASGISLMDAYVYGGFELGDMPLDLRLGRQVVSWGESTFIQNSVNVINPVDVNALRNPGSELKDALLPVGLVYASLGLTPDLSLETFYQYDWESVVLPGCGTYFSTTDVIGGDGCNKLTSYSSDQPLSDAELVAEGAKHGAEQSPLTGYYDEYEVFHPYWHYEGGYVARAEDGTPEDGGQYGLALRWFAEAINSTEFGLYYVNYHERFPIFSVIAGQDPRYFFEYPEDTKVFALSFNTNLDSWSVSGEISHRPDMPLQINTTELVQPLVKGDAAWSTMHGEIANAPDGTVVHGYDNYGMTQVQTTFINFVDHVLGASRLAFVAEVGMDYVHGLPDQSERRYGRSPVYGMGDFDSFDPFDPANPRLALNPEVEDLLGNRNNVNIDGAISCENASVTLQAGAISYPASEGKPNVNAGNCTNEGYITTFSWGFRTVLALEYSDVFSSGINLKPSVAYSRDMVGYAPAPNFNEGDVAINYKLTGDYNNAYTAGVSYTEYKQGRYNPLIDRDFLSLSFSYSF